MDAAAHCMVNGFKNLVWTSIAAAVFLGLTILSMPETLVLNGGFDLQVFELPGNESYMKISKPKRKNPKMPNWKVANGSVQVASSKFYLPDSATWTGVGNYCLHLNDEKGPGTIYSDPLIGQIAGGVYNFSFVIAGNPLGGDLYKELQITLWFRRKWFFWWFVEFKYPPYNASNPYGSRERIGWRTQMYSYVGTGRQTNIQIRSKSGGSFGFLIDNVRVELYNLLENGSFEQLTRVKNTTTLFLDSDIVQSPSFRIRKWSVESGNVKYIRGRLQSSNDQSPSSIDLNGDAPGLLTSQVSTINKKYYYISFEYAGNPEAGKTVKGYFSVSVYKEENASSSTTKKWVWVTNKGSNKYQVGWKTKIIGFYAKSNVTYIKFQSSIKGAFGPLLDNVKMYQYTLPFSAATSVTANTFTNLAVLLLGVSVSLHMS